MDQIILLILRNPVDPVLLSPAVAVFAGWFDVHDASL
jgi:hypothetical protein